MGVYYQKRRVLFVFLLAFAQVKTFSLPENYESEVRPNNGGVADLIKVSIKSLSINTVDDNEQNFSIELFLHTSWVDQRLVDLVERETVFSGKLPNVWIPNLDIANTAQAPTRSGTSLTLKPDGNLDLSERISAKISCAMSMVRYPFGKQHCSIQLNSNGYNTVHLNLLWNGMITASEVITFDPEYSISEISQSEQKRKSFSGEYVHIIVSISFLRSSFRLIVRALLPTLILTVMSYVITYFTGMVVGTADAIKQRRECGGNKKSAEDIEEHSTSELQGTSPPTLTQILLFDILRLAANAFILLIVVLVNQVHFLKSPRSSSPTALDVWSGVMSVNIFICFLLSLQICFQKGKSVLQGDIRVQERRRCGCGVTLKIFKILRIAIPVVFLIFFIAYLGFYLS